MEKIETDVVIVGSGGAGLSGALTAAERGVDAIVIDGATKLGGTFAYSAGLVWVPGNHFMEGLGITDSPELGIEHVRELSGRRHDEAVLRRFMESSPQVIRWLVDTMHVPFEPVVSYPDYYADRVGGQAAGRHLAVPVFPTQELLPPEWQARLATSPHFAGLPASWVEIQSWGGLASMAAWDWEMLAERLMADTRGFGSAIAGYMLAECVRRNVRFRTETRATELLVEGERVVGVRTLGSSGATGEIHARLGVLLATGGYDSNQRAKAQYDPYTDTKGIGSPGVDGSGLTMALEIGAAFQALDGQLTTPSIHVPGEEADGRPLFRSAVREPAYPGGIVVNAGGRRFCDESFYRSLCHSMMHFDVVTQSYPNEVAWFLFDEEWKQTYSLGPVNPGEVPPWLATGATPTELAAAIAVDGAQLELTVRGYNEHAIRGEDPQFRRGSTLYGRNTGDKRVQPNPNVRALTGRLYAIRLHVASSGTNNGLRFTPDGEVLHVRERTIPGLYAAGNVGANLSEGLFYNSGLSNAKSLTFGHLAVDHMIVATAGVR